MFCRVVSDAVLLPEDLLFTDCHLSRSDLSASVLLFHMSVLLSIHCKGHLLQK